MPRSRFPKRGIFNAGQNNKRRRHHGEQGHAARDCGRRRGSGVRAGDPSGAGEIPLAADDLGRPVSGRRHDRPARPRLRAEADRSLGPAGRHRERQRGRRLDRRGQSREGRARRLHAAAAQRDVLDHHHVADGDRPRQAHLRRLHAGVARRQRAADRDVPSVGAGEGPEGVRRLHQGAEQDRQGRVLRLDRAGQRDASLGRDA